MLGCPRLVQHFLSSAHAAVFASTTAVVDGVDVVAVVHSSCSCCRSSCCSCCFALIVVSADPGGAIAPFSCWKLRTYSP